MITIYRNMVIRKIQTLSKEDVSKVLIFMAGMEAERGIDAAYKIQGRRSRPGMNAGREAGNGKNKRQRL